MDFVDETDRNSDHKDKEKVVPLNLNASSSRFQKYQDIEIIEEDDLHEVDRYLKQKFDLSKYQDEAGKFHRLVVIVRLN